MALRCGERNTAFLSHDDASSRHRSRPAEGILVGPVGQYVARDLEVQGLTRCAGSYAAHYLGQGRAIRTEDNSTQETSRRQNEESQEKEKEKEKET